MINLFKIPPAILHRRAEEAASGVTHTTWDPEGPGVIRLHLVPPKAGLRRHPSLLFINGQHIVPVHHGWAALLRTFMNELNDAYKPGKEVDENGMKAVLEKVAVHMSALYPEVKKERFIADLGRLQDIIRRVAFGEPVPELEGKAMTLSQYAPLMRAPHRMDLAVMPMRIDDTWSCPLACCICYANIGPAMQVTKSKMLSTAKWKAVLDLLWQAGVPQVSFTGGEPLARRDIVQLVSYAQEFITRLNTSAVLLTRELAQELRAASLDVLQVTVYSFDPKIHDNLVGRIGAWKKTMQGIHNALNAGLQVSINTPLVQDNIDGYASTLRFLAGKGLRYFTCSGMLPAGGAKKQIATGAGVPNQKLFNELSLALAMAKQLNIELDFTSPGCLTDAQFAKLGMNIPVCGACLGNMAIAPDGEVLPCQSWVHQKESLGNILLTPWSAIWNHPQCKRVRKEAALLNVCPLTEEV